MRSLIAFMSQAFATAKAGRDSGPGSSTGALDSGTGPDQYPDSHISPMDK